MYDFWFPLRFPLSYFGLKDTTTPDDVILSLGFSFLLLFFGFMLVISHHSRRHSKLGLEVIEFGFGLILVALLFAIVGLWTMIPISCILLYMLTKSIRMLWECGRTLIQYWKRTKNI